MKARVGIIAGILTLVGLGGVLWARRAKVGAPPDVSLFGFTEIIENALPDYIIGWAQATCYDYVPPEGYKTSQCSIDVTLGTHGGCPYCIMSLIRCDKII